MTDPHYAAAVKDSFIKKPLRTVLMIDDAFPTYSDLCNDDKTRSQKDRAAKLYGGFRALDMLCDIENTVEEVEADRLRKSDLIVLDYHLTPNSKDTTKAVRLLRQLATSHHFNTVIVYTAESNQEEVWLDVIASLSGGWSAITAGLDGEPKQYWEDIRENENLPKPTREAVMQFARRGVLRDIEADTLKVAVDELTQLGVPANHCSKILEYLIAKELADRAGSYAAEPSGHAVGDYANGRRWIQVGNAFVVIMQKVDVGDETSAIMAVLNEALLDWHPNIIQMLISEIQNALELEGFAGSDALLRKPDMQAALTYNLLKDLGPVDLSKDVSFRVPVMSLVDKVIDSIRGRLAAHDVLLDQVEKVLVGDLKSAGWTLGEWPKDGKLVTAASNLARVVDAKKSNVLFRLNHFLSTEKFRHAHLATGTIFYHRAKDEYFVVASPACDLAAGQEKAMQLWATAINPILPVLVIRLYSESVDKALSAAAHAEHLFLEIGDEPKAFKVTNGNGHQPSYEIIFAQDEGRVRTQGGKIVFDGARFVLKELAKAAEIPEELPAAAEPVGINAEGATSNSSVTEQAPVIAAAPSGTAETSAQPETTQSRTVLDYDTFEIVEQLRGVNATHVLQLAGQHLSRIGLDFVSAPKN